MRYKDNFEQEIVQVGAHKVPLFRVRVPSEEELEYAEFAHYEEGRADRDAELVEGTNAEPWLNVIDRFEPGVPQALEAVLSDPVFGKAVRGRVVDLGAGTCWAAARISRVAAVTEVVAIDLSPRFLSTVGTRVFSVSGGDASKLRLLASNFEDTGLDSASCDAVFLIAALHHALAPIKVIREVRRIISPDGVLFVVETPAPVVGIERRRRSGLAEWERSRCTEIAYTRKEFEYLLACGGMDLLATRSLGSYSKRFWKRLVRSALRKADLEHIFLPAMYLFAARPRGVEQV